MELSKEVGTAIFMCAVGLIGGGLIGAMIHTYFVWDDLLELREIRAKRREKRKRRKERCRARQAASRCSVGVRNGSP